MHTQSRLNVIIDEQNHLITIRPIGALPAMAFVDQLLAALLALHSPWTYRCVNDLRRWNGRLDAFARSEIARRWAEITRSVDVPTAVAIVTNDPSEHLRRPRTAAGFPNEVMCDFTDYHEAVGWLLAADRDSYLSTLGAVPIRRRDEHATLVE